MNWQPVVPSPKLLVLPPDVDSLDEANGAIELWEHYARKTLDPAQRLTVQVMMAESGGRWAARTTGREMPRQNGKGEELEVVELWGIVQRGESILHTAHELFTVSRAHERMVALIVNNPDLNRRKAKVLSGLGQQYISMRGGGEIAYRTRTKGGGRGLDDISRLVVDEAQHVQAEQLASSTPTLFANPNPQQNFIGTGGIAEVSGQWWQIRKRALGADTGSFGYVGHTAEDVHLDEAGQVVQPPVRVEDRSLWAGPNPALAAGRSDMEFLEEQLRNLGATLFAREHLCVWDPPPVDLDAGLVAEWDLLEDPLSRIKSHRAIALDVADGRRSAAFGWAGRRADGLLHVEAFDHRAGTGWVQAAGEALWRKWKVPIRVQGGSPAASFVEPLREAGVTVVELSAQDQARGLGQLLDAASEKQVRHIGQASLTDAVKGGELRNLGDVVVIQRRGGGADVSPIVAVVLAVSGVPAAAPVRRPKIHVLKEVVDR